MSEKPMTEYVTHKYGKDSLSDINYLGPDGATSKIGYFKYYYSKHTHKHNININIT